MQRWKNILYGEAKQSKKDDRVWKQIIQDERTFFRYSRVIAKIATRYRKTKTDNFIRRKLLNTDLIFRRQQFFQGSEGTNNIVKLTLTHFQRGWRQLSTRGILTLAGTQTHTTVHTRNHDEQ